MSNEVAESGLAKNLPNLCVNLCWDVVIFSLHRWIRRTIPTELISFSVPRMSWRCSGLLSQWAVVEHFVNSVKWSLFNWFCLFGWITFLLTYFSCSAIKFISFYQWNTRSIEMVQLVHVFTQLKNFPIFCGLDLDALWIYLRKSFICLAHKRYYYDYTIVKISVADWQKQNIVPLLLRCQLNLFVYFSFLLILSLVCCFSSAP